MANGLSGFAQGLTSGLQQGYGLASSIDKDKREQEIFAMEKEKKSMELDELRRKDSMRKQIAEGLAAVETELKGGTVGGQAQDEFGTDLGNMQYSDPAAAKASGLSFKQGTAIEQAPKQYTQNQIDRMRAEVFQKARIDNGLMDEDWYEKQRKINKTLKKEGFKEAFEFFEETGDSDGAMDIYKKTGKNNKVPPGAFMKKDVDPETGFETIVVYAPDAQGKPRKITSSFDFYLADMPEELIKYGMGMKKEKYVQGESNKRTGMEVKGRVDAALISASGRDGADKKDRVKERIDKYAVEFAKGLTSNPNVSYNIDEFRRAQPQIAARAYQYMTGRVEGQKSAYDDEALAIQQATDDILGKPKK